MTIYDVCNMYLSVMIMYKVQQSSSLGQAFAPVAG